MYERYRSKGSDYSVVSHEVRMDSDTDTSDSTRTADTRYR